MKTTIATIIIAAGVVSAFADTTTNSIPWVSSASLGVTLTRGNSDTTLITAKVQTERKGPVNELSFGADGTYGTSSGVENSDSLHGFGQWNYLFSDKFYVYAHLDGLHDAIADIKYRVTLSPGAGYYFIKETNTSLSAEVGPGVVFERLGTNDLTFATLRIGEKFEHKFAGHGARVWETFEIMPQVSDFNNYIMNAEIGIEASIVGNLSLQAYIDDSFNNAPAAGRQKNDLKLVTGISYKF